MSFLKNLSEKFYQDAKKLNYTWMDLVKKDTRKNTIKQINRFNLDKIKRLQNKAKLESIKNKQKAEKLKKMEDEVKREHVKIMKQQKTKTEIEQLAKALKGHVESFKISVINNKDPLLQLQKTRKAIEKHIIKILTSKKGLKFIETLRVTFRKPQDNLIEFKTAFFNSKAQEITNNVMAAEALKLSKDQILNIIA